MFFAIINRVADIFSDGLFILSIFDAFFYFFRYLCKMRRNDHASVPNHLPFLNRICKQLRIKVLQNTLQKLRKRIAKA